MLFSGGIASRALRRMGLVPVLAALFFTALLPAASFAATTQEAANGTWVIDVDKTFAVNARWKSVYDDSGPEERAALRANWEKKELVVDFAAYSLEELTEGKRTQRVTVAEVHREGNGLRMKALPQEHAPYHVDMTLQDKDTLLLVIDGKTPVMLTRKKTGW